MKTLNVILASKEVDITNNLKKMKFLWNSIILGPAMLVTILFLAAFVMRFAVI